MTRNAATRKNIEHLKIVELSLTNINSKILLHKKKLLLSLKFGFVATSL